MDIAVLTVIGFIGAALATGLAGYFWREISVLSEEIQAKATELLDSQDQVNIANTAIEDLTEQLKDKSDAITRAQRDIQRVQAEVQDLTACHSEEVSQLTRENRKLDNLSQHLKEQSEAFERQITELEHGRKLLAEQTNKLDQQITEYDRKLRMAKDEAAREAQRTIDELTRKNKALTDKLAAAEEAAAQADPQIIRSLKRKVAQYGHFVLAARTQKQMLEERNQNWEKALMLMGKWIINTDPKLKADEITGLGPVVGTALEVVGVQLVEDEFSALSVEAKAADGDAETDSSSESTNMETIPDAVQHA